MEINEPLIIDWYTDDSGNKISIERLNQSYKIMNNQISILEVLDEYHRVQIDNMIELKSYEEIINENEFKVFYPAGIIKFHPNKDGQTINIKRYYSKGLFKLSASHIYTKQDPSGNVIQTLQDIIDAYDAPSIELSSDNVWTGCNTFNKPIVSNVSQGTTPIQVQSSTVVNNLNANLLEGKHASDFASKDIATQTANGLMSSIDKTKLDGVASNANNYVHPSTHSADMIADGTNNKVLTANNKTKLDKITVTNNVNLDDISTKVSSTNIKTIRDNSNIFEYSLDGATWKQVQGSIDDASSSTTTTWSSNKIITEQDSKIGVLDNLNTTAKTDVVSAINEVFQSGVNVKSNVVAALNSKGQSVTTPTISSSWSDIVTSINNLGQIRFSAKCSEQSNPSTTMKDKSVLQNNAILYNFSYTTGSGWSGNTLNFDGINDYVSLLANMSGMGITTGDFTIEIDLQINAEDTSGWCWILAQANAGANPGFGVASNNGMLRITFGNWFTDITTKPTISFGTRHMIAIKRQSSVTSVLLDNVSVGTGVTNNTDFLSIYNIPLKIGTYNTEYANMKLYALRIYNYAVPNSQLTYNYNNWR